MRFLASTRFVVSVACAAASLEEYEVHVASRDAFVQKIKLAFGIINEREYEKKIEEILKRDPRYIFDDKTSKFTLSLDDKYRKSYVFSDYESSWLRNIREISSSPDGSVPDEERTISYSEEEIANFEKYAIEVRKMMTLCRNLEWEANGCSYDDLIKLVKELSKILNQLLPESYTKDSRGVKDLVTRLENLVPRAECKKKGSLSVVAKDFFDHGKDPINNLIVMLFMLKGKGMYPKIPKDTILDVAFEFFEHLKYRDEALEEKFELWRSSEKMYHILYLDNSEPLNTIRRAIVYNEPYCALIVSRPDNFNFVVLLAKFVSFALPEEFTTVFEGMETNPRLVAFGTCYGMQSILSSSGHIYPELIKKVIGAGHGDRLADWKDGYLELFLTYLFSMFILRVVPVTICELESACVIS